MTSQNNERFNAEAATWDNRPGVEESNQHVWTTIQAAVPDLMSAKRSIDVLELGCGTGGLSLLVAPTVRSLVAIDAAPGMIERLKKKLETSDAKGSSTQTIHPLCLVLQDPEDSRLPPHSADDPAGPRRKYDLILSHLMLHHIPDLSQLLRTMHGCLKPGGWIVLTDFEDFGPEARKYHPASKLEGVERHGIQRESFRLLMQETDFVDVEVTPAWTFTKKVERYPGEWEEKPDVERETMDFPFLLCKGRKRDLP
ncbi:hypothetical protein ASPZODRAFT_1910975 [Penicilliopsis zonata CBS 506.65]|uniref:Methyltransferase domain-containing protein n=1 Tax=Penicilliopsis zonata CBS 506.65 TaxID=1073090 RepID=A0A1L9SJ46_9EURO|nr:hypothetical protein ASPZODRAFT_1910975 [Penicilliopsis zonata CBS 506.65]OJJ47177.1 hypothetical protein ASPZODRAFT_1910975 [Penicilliopsis zonata CBS 506.65]